MDCTKCDSTADCLWETSLSEIKKIFTKDKNGGTKFTGSVYNKTNNKITEWLSIISPWNLVASGRVCAAYKIISVERRLANDSVCALTAVALCELNTTYKQWFLD